MMSTLQRRKAQGRVDAPFAPGRSVDADVINAALAAVFPNGPVETVRSRMLLRFVRDLEARAVASPQAAASSPEATRPMARTRAGTSKGQVRRMTAETFWQTVQAALTSARAELGERWAFTSADNCRWITVPSGLRSYRGPRGTMIRNPSDLRVPAPRFWPGGSIPERIEVKPDFARETCETMAKRQRLVVAGPRMDRVHVPKAPNARTDDCWRKRRVRKLHVMTTDRGCTPAEAETARRLAEQMEAA